MAMSRKTKIGIIIFLLLMAVPVVLLSEWFLGMIQASIDKTYDKSKNTDPSAGWQLFIARAYDMTLRKRAAVPAYRRYLQRVEPKTQQELFEYVEVKYNYATALEAIYKAQEASDEYYDIVQNYPDHPCAKAAEKAYKRIEYGVFALPSRD
jgi:hypothetical protein